MSGRLFCGTGQIEKLEWKKALGFWEEQDLTIPKNQVLFVFISALCGLRYPGNESSPAGAWTV